MRQITQPVDGKGLAVEVRGVRELRVDSDDNVGIIRVSGVDIARREDPQIEPFAAGRCNRDMLPVVTSIAPVLRISVICTSKPAEL